MQIQSLSIRNFKSIRELEITGEDLQQFHAQGLVSGYKKFDAWMQEVQELLPSFKENMLAFTCVINHSGKVRYDDGTNKHNPHIMEILPKLHFIDTTRNLATNFPLATTIILSKPVPASQSDRKNEEMGIYKKRHNNFPLVGI